jgi:hypothetical protein
MSLKMLPAWWAIFSDFFHWTIISTRHCNRFNAYDEVIVTGFSAVKYGLIIASLSG